MIFCRFFSLYKEKKRRKKRNSRRDCDLISQSLLYFLSFSFWATFTHGQSIVKAALPLAFSLLCPCCASLHLPQAALGSAPFHSKRKSRKEKS
jgi:hypothetical protein